MDNTQADITADLTDERLQQAAARNYRSRSDSDVPRRVARYRAVAALARKGWQPIQSNTLPAAEGEAQELTLPEPGFRALCFELVEKLDELNCHYNVPNQSAMIERALAALSQRQSPAPVPPLPPRPPVGECHSGPSPLTRWGVQWNGPDKPITVPMNDGFWTPWHVADELLRQALAIAPAPVLTRERPWEQEGWCNKLGRCWMGDPGHDEFIPSWRLCRPEDAPRMVWSLPHWAISVPTLVAR